ncbi:MAG: glutaredoxin family protein [Myxococcales bacterium]|nr:MAG: glutaredoxin family protein [Myxococcales bacterium]
MKLYLALLVGCAITTSACRNDVTSQQSPDSDSSTKKSSKDDALPQTTKHVQNFPNKTAHPDDNMNHPQSLDLDSSTKKSSKDDALPQTTKHVQNFPNKTAHPDDNMNHPQLPTPHPPLVTQPTSPSPFNPTSSIKLYGNPVGCGLCTASEKLLQEKGIKYESINIHGNHQLTQEVKQKFQVPDNVRYPYVIIDGKYIGGYNELSGLLNTTTQPTPAVPHPPLVTQPTSPSPFNPTSSIKLYGNPVGCGLCTASEKLLQEKGIKYESINIHGNHQLTQEVKQKFQVPDNVRYPYVIIDGKYIGGYNELSKLLASPLSAKI